MKNISIAVDGPSGAGKSTLARAIASKYKFIYVDTGAIYRTVGLAAQYAKVDSKDIEGVIAILPDVKIEMCYDDEGVQRMLLGGKDVSAEIRTPLSSIYASDVSAIPEVRAFLMDMQRDMAKKYSVIMDGRDIGTVVLPNAELKVFMTASAEARAQRRYTENLAKGFDSDLNKIIEEIKQRDWQDTHREHSPLKKAEDAVVLDTSELNIDEVVSAIEAMLPL